MSKYSRERYLRTREKLPRKNQVCALDGCGKELPRFGKRRCRKYCSEEHFIKAKEIYKKIWEIEHLDNVRAWKKKYYEKVKNNPEKKHVYKVNKIKKLQTIRGTGAFPE